MGIGRPFPGSGVHTQARARCAGRTDGCLQDRAGPEALSGRKHSRASSLRTWPRDARGAGGGIPGLGQPTAASRPGPPASRRPQRPKQAARVASPCLGVWVIFPGLPFLLQLSSRGPRGLSNKVRRLPRESRKYIESQGALGVREKRALTATTTGPQLVTTPIQGRQPNQA